MKRIASGHDFQVKQPGLIAGDDGTVAVQVHSYHSHFDLWLVPPVAKQVHKG